MIPETIGRYLEDRGIRYDVVRHFATANSQETAQAAHVPSDRLAKAVVLEDGEEFLLAVIPASHRLDPIALERVLARPVYLAEERDFAIVFRDCKRGAVPPFGELYGIPTIVDDALLDQPEVYFECGDHERVVHVDHDAFSGLMRSATHARISRHT